MPDLFSSNLDGHGQRKRIFFVQWDTEKLSSVNYKLWKTFYGTFIPFGIRQIYFCANANLDFLFMVI